MVDADPDADSKVDAAKAAAAWSRGCVSSCSVLMRSMRNSRASCCKFPANPSLQGEGGRGGGRLYCIEGARCQVTKD